MPQKYVTLDSVATFVHHRGPTTLPGAPPDLSRGAPIVCIHGAGDNGNSFGPLLDALAANHSPISFDFPAHGRSGGLDSLGDIAVMAAHTKALVDQLGIANPVLVGNGMGAAVAVEARCLQPRLGPGAGAHLGLRAAQRRGGHRHQTDRHGQGTT